VDSQPAGVSERAQGCLCALDQIADVAADGDEAVPALEEAAALIGAAAGIIRGLARVLTGDQHLFEDTLNAVVGPGVAGFAPEGEREIAGADSATIDAGGGEDRLGIDHRLRAFDLNHDQDKIIGDVSVVVTLNIGPPPTVEQLSNWLRCQGIAAVGVAAGGVLGGEGVAGGLGRGTELVG
jgi:hypothetical protein